jgi:hypothetical protein
VKLSWGFGCCAVVARGNRHISKTEAKLLDIIPDRSRAKFNTMPALIMFRGIGVGTT